MKSIVFAILLYFVCASITCNNTEENASVNTASNTVPASSATCAVCYLSSAAIGISAIKFFS